MAAKALDLFQAYAQEKLPKDGGYIVSSFFDRSSTYSRYEVVAYSTVKSLYLTEEGLTFQTDGNKLFILVEPANYSRKFVEPVNRDSNAQIPHRFSELNIYTAKNQTKVMVSRDPVITYSSFTVLKPTGVNFALFFYNLEGVMQTLEFFFAETLNKEARVPSPDAKKAAKYVAEGIKKFSIW
ncbi:MAG: hypothetical protein JW852_07405 [Spirochaetales bacterium]|nr:hypothetical protein [Spirochaetales bacterium]